MPFYVYRCQTCAADFERLRAMGQADTDIACPVCGTSGTAKRKLTTFATLNAATKSAATPVAQKSGGCCGGNCGCGRN